MQSPYRVLGIPEDAPEADVECAYKSLVQGLAPGNFPFNQRARQQAEQCLKAIEEAFATISDTTKLNDYKRRQIDGTSGSGTTHPRLGQLCVASGMISVEQLEEAVKAQFDTGLPLGEILEDKQFLSHAELEGLLLGQDLIDIDSTCSDPSALRLIGLRLASEDMVLVAQMEKKVRDVPIHNIFLDRGWLEPEVATALAL
jgi:hypothetical protein